MDAVRRYHRRFPVHDIDDIGGVFQNGRDVGGDEVLAQTDTDDQGVLLPSHYYAVGAELHRRDGISAADILQRPHQGGVQVPLHIFAHQMHQDLGVGLGAEDVTLLRELLSEGDVVLDDAVVHQRDTPVHAAEGVGIPAGRFPACGPAGVSYPGVSVYERNRVPQQGDLPLLFVDDDFMIDDSHSHGVIASVLQFDQGVQYDVAGYALTGISHDAAHQRASVLDFRFSLKVTPALTWHPLPIMTPDFTVTPAPNFDPGPMIVPTSSSFRTLSPQMS